MPTPTKIQTQTIFFLFIISVSNCAYLPTLMQPTYFDNDTVQWFPEILGGTPISLDQMNGVVSIQNRYGYHLCSGTLVSYKLVLTAANCLLNQNGTLLDPSEIRVIADDIVIVGDGSATRQIQEIKNYYAPPSNGIALVVLLNPFVESSSLTYNAVSNYTVSDGQICQLIGWGSSPPNSGIRLQQINVKIMSNEVANSTNYYNSSMPASTIAATALNNSCFGDLGSALVCDEFINGILSFGYGCSRSDFPIIFSNTYELIADKRVNMIPATTKKTTTAKTTTTQRTTSKPITSTSTTYRPITSEPTISEPTNQEINTNKPDDDEKCVLDENGEHVCGAATIKLSIALALITVYRYFFNKFIA